MKFISSIGLIAHYYAILKDMGINAKLIDGSNSEIVSLDHMAYDPTPGLDPGWHHFRLVDNNTYEEIASFKLMELPGCSAFMLSFRAHTTKNWMGKGIGLLLNQMRIDIASFLGYSGLLCTDNLGNVSQRSILSKNGWKDVFTTINKRSGNKIAISLKELI